jgi:hypothetical protein
VARKLFDNGLLSIIKPDSSIEVGAKLYWYVADTTTPATTYTTPDGSTENTNPVLAVSDGRFPEMWLEPGDYKYILTQADSTPADPDVTVNDYTVDDAPPSIDPTLYNFLAGTDPLPVANGGTNATSAVNAAAELEVLPLAGGELTGQVTQDGAGALLYNAAGGQVQGGVFVTIDSDPDPTSLAGQWWAKYQ